MLFHCVRIDVCGNSGVKLKLPGRVSMQSSDASVGQRAAEPIGSAQRLLLVNPTIVDKREHVHIGLGTVGTYVKRHSRHEVRILDFMAFRRTWRQHLHRVLDEYRPDLIGMYVSS